jgi:hypothetical protein
MRQQTATIAACEYSYEVVAQNPADGEDGGVFPINTDYEREITLRNTSQCAWEANTALTYIQGEDFDAGPFITIRERVEPGAEVILTFAGQTPSQGGLRSGSWELRTAGQIPIGEPLIISIRSFDSGNR